MDFPDVLMITSDPATSGLIWFVIFTILLYIARIPAHQAITAFSAIMHSAFRLSARSVKLAERSLATRNREVLLNAGQEAVERDLARELERMEAAVERELSAYPSLQRRINEEFTAVEEDYKQSAEVPPAPIKWTKAIEEVAKIPAKTDPMVAEVLEAIHRSLVKAHDKALNEYRKATADRHQHLKDILPRWRNIQKAIEQIGSQVDSLLSRAKTISRHLIDYEEIVKRTDKAERILSSSASTQFFISAFVLAIAIGGAMINFSLIARPMAEMVGGNRLLGGFRTSEVAALVIIFVETALGIFLMESLRFTRLFPIIGALQDRKRIIMAWIAFGFLFCLASIEAGLAFMREVLMEEDMATAALLRGNDVSFAASDLAWITTAAQMGLGFILPFVLVMVAIPLESFVHSTRTVLGLLGLLVLRGLVWLLRVIGTIFFRLGAMLRSAYDLLIFIPLWADRSLRSYLQKNTDDELLDESTVSQYRESPQ